MSSRCSGFATGACLTNEPVLAAACSDWTPGGSPRRRESGGATMGSIRCNLPRVLLAAAAAVTVTVGTAAAEVAAAGPAAAKTGPVLSFPPSPDDFGAVTIGQTATHTLTLANTGGSPTRALTVALSGPAGFAITGNACTGTSLAPGKKCAVTVQFAPSTLGTVTALLTAISNKGTVTATDPLTGTGQAVPHLYCANFGAFPNTGTIQEANPDGTGVTTVATGQNGPYGVAVGASQIYWADRNNGTIMAANLDGTGVTTLVTGQSFPVGVAVSAGYIYWTTIGTTPGSDSIMRANLDGTGVTTLVTGQNSAGAVALDASHVYWTDSIDGTIMRVNVDGSGVTALVTGQSGAAGLAVDASHLYWLDDAQTGSTIMSANLDGTGVTTLVTGLDQPEGIAVDASHIYWSDTSIFEANLDGSNPHALITGLNFGPAGVAIGPQ